MGGHPGRAVARGHRPAGGLQRPVPRDRRAARVLGLADAVNAKLVRRAGGLPEVTDGPYLETKEYLASFWLLDCESEERAQQIAADMPFADTDPVELWPILHESAGG